jgi:hypothetical protein
MLSCKGMITLTKLTIFNLGIALYLLCNFQAHAGKVYGSIVWDWTAVTSQRDLTNGASGSTIGFDLGYRFVDLSLEVTYRKFELNEIFTEPRGTFGVQVEDALFGFGLRYNHLPWIHSKIGWAFHKVEGSFPLLNSATPAFLTSVVDGTFGGVYVGFGLNWWGNEYIDLYTDLTFHRASSEISHMGWGIGIRGYFFEL